MSWICDQEYQYNYMSIRLIHILYYTFILILYLPYYGLYSP